MTTTETYDRFLTGGMFRVGIMGQGYVGLPLALAFARKITAVGFDVSGFRVAELLAGHSGLSHVPDDQVQKALRMHRYRPTADVEQLAKCHAVVICVPTPLGHHREPDLSYIRAAAEILAPQLRPGMLVVLESTSYPGTTEEVVAPILARSSWPGWETPPVAGKDFFLAYSPEREDPGNGKYSTETIPKVVGGLTAECQRRAVLLYERAVRQVVPVSSLRVAEMSKLYENIFRCVNIALVNELKTVCEAMGLDIWEVIEAARTKPFGFMPFYPGPGLGGHCIPVDPFYLTWKAHEYGAPTRFIELAGEINGAMPERVVQKLREALGRRRKSLEGSLVLVVGVAYKPNVEDIRESPAIRIWHLLKAAGAQPIYHDPMVQAFFCIESVPLNRDTLKGADAVLIHTDHDGVDYQAIADHADLVVDTRNAMRRRNVSGPGCTIVRA